MSLHKRKALQGFLVICGLIASGYFVANIARDVYTYFAEKNSLAQIQAKYEEVLEKKEQLEEKRRRLINPDYVELYSRGRYLVSKPEEQIFKCDPIESQKDQEALEKTPADTDS